MQAESLLRAQVQLRIDQGKLPNRAADRMWGGKGVNADCAVCDACIPETEMELEVEFVRDQRAYGLDVYHVHIRCYAVWMLLLHPSAS